MLSAPSRCYPEVVCLILGCLLIIWGFANPKQLKPHLLVAGAASVLKIAEPLRRPVGSGIGAWVSCPIIVKRRPVVAMVVRRCDRVLLAGIRAKRCTRSRGGCQSFYDIPWHFQRHPCNCILLYDVGHEVVSVCSGLRREDDVN